MFTVQFTGKPDKKDGRRKKLAKATVHTDSAASALSGAMAIVQKQSNDAQAALDIVTVKRVETAQKEIVFAVGERAKAK